MLGTPDPTEPEPEPEPEVEPEGDPEPVPEMLDRLVQEHFRPIKKHVSTRRDPYHNLISGESSLWDSL